jgi:hypothetical protein
MARTTKFLLEQIESAKRLAAALTSPADRELLEKLANDYQKEIDQAAAASGDQQASSATETTPAADVSETEPSDAVASRARQPRWMTNKKRKARSFGTIIRKMRNKERVTRMERLITQ